MVVPAWLNALVGAAVVAFGVVRLLQARKAADRPRRAQHLLMGVTFVALGGWLLATALGLVAPGRPPSLH